MLIVYVMPLGPVGVTSTVLTVTERLSPEIVKRPAGGVGEIVGASV